MKQKIKLTDGITNTTIEKEVTIPNKMHLETQIKYRTNIQRDKTNYTRKQKHRNREDY